MLLIDWISLAIIGALGFSGFYNGFAKELSSAAAWVISIVGAWYFGPFLFPYLEAYLNNLQVKSIISFIVFFIILFAIVRLAGSIISKFLSAIGLSSLDKSLGFFFGATKAITILVSVFILSSTFIENKSWWNESLSKEWTTKIARVMEPLIKDWKAQSEILLDKGNVTSPPTL
tara:strand:- start:218 stop:739 length:522 start_codon:yes stop_codon:yes gene_type:complete